MKVLSIQSHVVCGHVGNAAAVFPLQLLGVEALPLHTVQYSNHPGRGGFRGAVTDAATIGDLAAGLDELGALAECNAVLTGYVADAVGSRAVHDAALLVKRRNPRAVYCCDPVMGDVEDGFFVAEEVRAHFIDVAAPAADIVTPNGFELAALTGIEPATVEEALAACAATPGSHSAYSSAWAKPSRRARESATQSWSALPWAAGERLSSPASRSLLGSPSDSQSVSVSVPLSASQSTR